MNRHLSYTFAALALLVGVVACDEPCRKGSWGNGRTATLQKVTFAEFEKAVADHKGKVVVVDVWGEFCPPCKKKFPHLVKIHEAFADKGVVAVSLSLDDADNQPAVVKFLTEQKAGFQNLRLEDSEDNKIIANRRIDISIPPLLHVFDRNGTLVKTFGGKSDDTEVERYIEKLVEGK